MVDADDLVAIWYHASSNHHDDVSELAIIRVPQYNAATFWTQYFVLSAISCQVSWKGQSFETVFLNTFYGFREYALRYARCPLKLLSGVLVKHVWYL